MTPGPKEIPGLQSEDIHKQEGCAALSSRVQTSLDSSVLGRLTHCQLFEDDSLSLGSGCVGLVRRAGHEPAFPTTGASVLT